MSSFPYLSAIESGGLINKISILLFLGAKPLFISSSVVGVFFISLLLRELLNLLTIEEIFIVCSIFFELI
tara:strand:+ start:269 stop:478 length:210 start_codon:yes stop_codon:yes gene_type:complete